MNIAINPDNGLIWQEGEIGWNFLDAAYAHGYNEGVNASVHEHADIMSMIGTEIEKSKPS